MLILGNMLMLLLSLSPFFSTVLAQTRDRTIATCGGEAVRASQGQQFSLDPFPAQGIADGCAGWRDEMVCCSALDSGRAANRTDALRASWTSELSKAARSNEDLHCFYGYYDDSCLTLATWLHCATSCDVLFPRNPETGEVKSRGCYEKFSSRKGLSSIILAGADTPCTRAKGIELGECDYVVVVGDSEDPTENVAVAVGDNRAICYSSNAKKVIQTWTFRAIPMLVGIIIVLS